MEGNKMIDFLLIHIFIGFVAGCSLPCIFVITAYITQLFFKKLKDLQQPPKVDSNTIDEKFNKSGKNLKK